MRRIWAICRKEMMTYFSSPVGYIATAVFLALSGFFFMGILTYTREADLRYLFNNMAIMLLLTIPMITMRLFAEEKRMGTFELLMTAPILLVELVLGKFLGAALLLAVIVGLTLQFPVFLMIFGSPDMGPVLTGYLGFALMSLSLAAIGLFVSTLTDSMFIAGIVSFGIMLALWILNWAGDLVGGPLGGFIRAASIIDRMDSFVKGILDTGDVLYYLSVIGIFIFLSVRALDWRRW